MLIFGPLVWATTSPETLTLASASASEVTAEPSTTSRAGSATLSPGPPETFSTSTTSPTATLYCLPPVLTMAYTEGSYLSSGAARVGAAEGRVEDATGSRLPDGPGGRRTLRRPPLIIRRIAVLRRRGGRLRR